MKISPSRQRNAVSEGVALGLLMCGRSTLAFNKVKVDLAFDGAWRDWTYSRRFSQVDTDLRKGLDAVWAMTHADEDKRVYNLYWEVSGADLVIHRRPQWTYGSIDFPAIADSIDGEVPAEGWRALAEDFLARYER